MHHPTDRIAHTTIFVTPVVEHWLEIPNRGNIFHSYQESALKTLNKIQIINYVYAAENGKLTQVHAAENGKVSQVYAAENGKLSQVYAAENGS